MRLLGVRVARTVARAVGALVLAGAIVAAAPAGAATDVTISASPRWGAVAPASWTPYSVTVRNDGGIDLAGDVVLVPQSEPPPKPGAPPTTTTTPSPTTTVLAIGARAVTAPITPEPDATAALWPTYRAPVALPAGSEKTLTVMVLEAPFGYRAELHDVTRGRVAEAPGPVPGASGCAPREVMGCTRTRVLLVSDIVGADAILEAVPDQGEPAVDVTQVRSARDFPDVGAHLAGLDGVIIDEFDTATLTASQRRALQNYVSLGGSLVLAGGGAWSHTLGSLPPGLVPLQPADSVMASLAPLADLTGATTSVMAPVVTGKVTAGRAVLAAPGGPPLVVEADYGAGRVVQLAYDPLAEPFASDESLRELAWDQGLGRVASRWGRVVTGSPPQDVAQDQLWGSVLAAQPWPSWPSWNVGLVGLYAVGLGSAAFILFRRSRRPVMWTAIPLGAGLMACVCLVAAQARSHASELIVEVRTLGVDGAVLATTYHGMRALDPVEAVTGAPGVAMSSIFTGDPVFRAVREPVDPLIPFGPAPPPVRGVGQGTVEVSGDRPALRLPTQPWAFRTLQTVTVEEGGPTLDATLRLVGASQSSPGRVTGTLTNHGVSPLRQLRAQIPEGQARLVEVLMPGATADVDAPIVTVNRAGGQLLPPTREDVAIFAAASRAFTAPGQVAVAGVADPVPTTSGGDDRGRVAVVVTSVPLQAADTVLAGTGGGRTVSVSPVPGGDVVYIFDMTAPPGVGPLSVRYRASLAVPNQPEPPRSSVEVYNWSAGTWSSLPPVGRPDRGYVEVALDDAEVNGGHVRVRHRTDNPIAVSPAANLLLTSASTDAAVQR